MKKLRLLSLKYCGLSSFSEVKELPENLEVLNLSGNKISSLKGLPATKAKIILRNTPLAANKSLAQDNLIFSDDGENIIQKEYWMYIQ